MLKLKYFLTNKKSSIAFYISGFLVLGFAVNTMNASNLGNGAWDTVFINVSKFFNMNLGIEWVTMGMVSFVVAFIIMAIILSYRKNLKYLFMIFPIFLVALSLDFWNFTLFHDRQADQLIFQIILYIVGILLLPLGLTMIVKSKFPAYVFDELMLMFVKITKARKITYVRLTIEILGISIGAIFGYLTYYHIDQSFGAVNIGSFIITILLSPIMAFYFKLFSIDNKS